MQRTHCPNCGRKIHAAASVPAQGVKDDWYFMGDREGRKILCFGGTYVHFTDGGVHKMVYQKSGTPLTRRATKQQLGWSVIQAAKHALPSRAALASLIEKLPDDDPVKSFLVEQLARLEAEQPAP